MPNITIHEKIGYELSKELNTNSYDYYLGLLSPDTPNLNGFGPKEERWASHVRRKDLNEWRNTGSVPRFEVYTMKNALIDIFCFYVRLIDIRLIHRLIIYQLREYLKILHL